MWTWVALRWSRRIGYAIVLGAAALVIIRGGRQEPPPSVDVGDTKAALAVSGHLWTPAAPIGRTADGAVIVRTADKGCWTVGLSAAGDPIWPASPTDCGDGGELDAVPADSASRAPVPSAMRDAATGWAEQVIKANGQPDRWAQPGVATPSGPWVGQLTGPRVDVTADGPGLFVAVTATWNGAPFNAGWLVTLAPRGLSYEVATVGPAVGGAIPVPSTTTSSTSSSTTIGTKGDAS